MAEKRARALTESRVLELIREEWGLKVEELEKDLDVLFKPAKGAEEMNVISPELKVKHKESGYRYTVDAIGTTSITLRTPEGELLDLSNEEFEKEYELD